MEGVSTARLWQSSSDRQDILIKVDIHNCGSSEWYLIHYFEKYTSIMLYVYMALLMFHYNITIFC
jgi:hypothetical protein